MILYIVFEGDNGTGKSTQLGRVKGSLDKIFKNSNDILESISDVKGYKQPHINIFHEGDTCKKSHDNWYATVFDYALDRVNTQHLIEEKYFPDITIADRSYYSSIVYQGDGDKPNMDYVRLVNTFAIEPEVIFLFTNNDNSPIFNEYKNVLPAGKTYIIDTSDDSIEKTTSHIVEIILFLWLKEYKQLPVDDVIKTMKQIAFYNEEIGI